MKKQSLNHLFRFSPCIQIVVGAAALMLMAAGAHAQYVATVISNGLFEPNGIATETLGNAYITDSSDDIILKFTPSTGELVTLAGSPGNASYSSGPGPFAAFANPLGIVVARGGVVVVDQANQVIRFLTTNGVVSATPIAGVPGVTGTNNGPGATALFNFPSGIAADASGKLYVVDQGNNAIRTIDTNNYVTNIVPANGYKFLQPTGVAVDDSGNIWVSDTGNQVICMISNQVVTVVAGTPGVSGSADFSPTGNTLLSLPTGILWDSANSRLLIADTGNDVIRSLNFTNFYGSSVYYLQTVAGISGDAGTFDAVPLSALFTAPVGLSLDPFDGGYYVLDRYGASPGGLGVTGTGTLRSYQASAPLPSPTAPVFGYVTFASSGIGEPATTVFNDASNAVFTDSAIIAIDTQPNTQTFITYGPPGSDIPMPGPSSGSSPNSYQGNGLTTAAPSIISPEPAVVIYAVSEGPGGKLSPVSSAFYQFVCANPIIAGNNAADLTLTDTTPGAAMYYTLDGAVPTNGAADTFGPFYEGAALSLSLTTNVVLSVRAFTNNFAPSGVATLNLTVSNYFANTVAFSPNTKVAGTGATLAVPIFTTLAISNAAVVSIQYRAEITPLGANTSPTAPLTALGFTPQDFLPLSDSGSSFNAVIEWEPYAIGNTEGVSIFTYTNSGLSITGNGPVGMVEIPIPNTVTYGQTYSLSIVNPSGTEDGNQTEVSLTGASNTVTITDPVYFAGDSSPANGYNAGEFGDGFLNNADVNNAMYASVGIRSPFVFSDAYNDMDVYPADDGDGQITLLDWQTILNRSLGLDTNNWIRFRTNGGTLMHQQVAWTPGTTPVPLSDAVPRITHSKSSDGPTPPGQVWLRQAVVGAGTQVNVAPGAICSIPVYVKVSSGSTLGGLQFRAILSSADGAAPAPGTIAFSPAAGVPPPTVLPGLADNDIACFWSIGSFHTSLQGSNYLGQLKFQVPSSAQKGASYVVHFSGVDGAPNMQTQYQLESFPGYVWVNSAAMLPPQISSDEWRITFFGSLTNGLAADNVDADGDGMLNWQEYLAGTNPTDAQSKFQFGTTSLNPTGVKGVALSWLTAPGKTYTLKSSPTVGGPAWTTVNSNVGDGYNYQFVQTNYSGPALFYQLSVSSQ